MQKPLEEQPDPDQGHAREWPSTPYSDEVRLLMSEEETPCRISLIGDCTVAGSYYPPANRPERHLAVRLRRTFPGQPFCIYNLAADGESAEDFLRPDRMDKALDALPCLNIAFIRYGINDRKQNGISGCIRSLEMLCRELKHRYPAIHLFIETGIWVDFPTHYLWNRNLALSPLYTAMRLFAEQAGHSQVDVFANMEAETQRGNWDLRVRGLPTPDHLIVDDSFDDLFGNDPAFFTNIHPNSRCFALVARWQAAAMQKVFEASSSPWDLIWQRR